MHCYHKIHFIFISSLIAKTLVSHSAARERYFNISNLNPFYLRRTKQVRKHCKFPKYYDQRCPNNFTSHFKSSKNDSNSEYRHILYSKQKNIPKASPAKVASLFMSPFNQN